MTDEQVENAMILAYRGTTLRKIGAMLGIEPFILLREIKALGRLDEFTAARNLGLEVRADDLLDAHEMEDLERAKIFSRNAQWVLTKRISHIYGDKITLDHRHEIDLSQAMRDASMRLDALSPQNHTTALPLRRDTQVIDIPYNDPPSSPQSDDDEMTPEERALFD